MLKSFAVKNYMSFGNDDYTTLTFEPDTNIIALFGINSSGKTNMLMAINTFMSYYQFHTANIQHPIFGRNTDGISVNTDGGFSMSMGNSTIKNFYTPNYFSNTEPTYFKAVFELDSKKYIYEYGYNASDTVFEELKIDSELIYSKNGSFETGAGVNDYLIATKRDIDTYKNELGKGIFFISLLAIRNVDYKGLLAFDEYIYNFTSSYGVNINQDENSLTRRINDNKIDVAFLTDIIVKADGSLSHMELKKEPNDMIIDSLRNQINTATDDSHKNMLNRRINLEENKLKLFIYTKTGVRIAYSTLSSGTKKMLALAVNLSIAAKQNKLMLIDEIENGLNAFLMYNLLELISYLDARVIFTTHNLDILDCVKKKEIVFIERKDGFNSVLERRDLSKIENLREHYLKMELGYLPNIE